LKTNQVIRKFINFWGVGLA